VRNCRHGLQAAEVEKFLRALVPVQAVAATTLIIIMQVVDPCKVQESLQLAYS